MKKRVIMSLVLMCCILLIIFVSFMAYEATPLFEGTQTAENDTEHVTTAPQELNIDDGLSTTKRGLIEDASLGEPESCPDTIRLKTPIDIMKVTSVLYPGQPRGDDFKPHGGFRFDSSNSKDIVVRMPYDAQVTQGSRYLSNGAVQYLFDFDTDCNISFRFDHLVDLSPKLQSLADTLPEPVEGDSRTTSFEPVSFTQGEIIATSVGMTDNVFVDFGVYDWRRPNNASETSLAIQAYPSELAAHAVCFFEWLPREDAATLLSLPPSGPRGSQSEYCDS